MEFAYVRTARCGHLGTGLQITDDMDDRYGYTNRSLADTALVSVQKQHPDYAWKVVLTEGLSYECYMVEGSKD
jgi:hypothetical protein